MADDLTALWENFREGDRQAFERLLQIFYGPLYEYGYHFQPDPAQLQDALHNLMVDLWERRMHLNATANLKLYLFKSLRHQIFREKHAASIWVSADTSDEEHPNELHTESENIEKQMIRKEYDQEITNKIKATLTHLSNRQQEILHLKFYEGLSNEEISTLLGISRPAVANLLYQALKIFRQHWQTDIFIFLSLYFSI